MAVTGTKPVGTSTGIVSWPAGVFSETSSRSTGWSVMGESSLATRAASSRAESVATDATTQKTRHGRRASWFTFGRLILVESPHRGQPAANRDLLSERPLPIMLKRLLRAASVAMTQETQDAMDAKNGT